MPKATLSGTRIRALRTARGIGQADLARQAGISPSYLNLIEHNRRRAGAKLLSAIAQVLGISPDVLDERAGDALVENLRNLAGGAARSSEVEAAYPELDRVEDFAGRFPGWASLIAGLGTRLQHQERLIERMSDRMAHDPNLSAALHEIVSAVTAVQSTSAILVETDDLDPEWRARFDANVYSDSVRLANAAEALVAFLDMSGEATGLAAPQEELESWLERQGYHIAALEAETSPDFDALIDGEPELASASSRGLATRWLKQAHRDAQALPLETLVPAVTAMLSSGEGFNPQDLAQQFGVSLAQLFRRLACLPPEGGIARFGLVVCDGSGTLTYRRPIEGFVLPRFGGACPLWPLYQALAQPGRPVRSALEFMGQTPTRFGAYAVALPRDPLAFDPPIVMDSFMLVTPYATAFGKASGAANTSDRMALAVEPSQLLGVGTSCRVCPRVGCKARRELSIVTR